MRPTFDPLIPLAPLLLLCSGCSSGPRFVAVPPDLDRSKVPEQTIEMTARDWEFEPEEIHVTAGTLLRLKVLSVEGTHGLSLPDFGIDVELEEGIERTVEVYLPESGEYVFECSRFCGLGHLWMNGTILVD